MPPTTFIAFSDLTDDPLIDALLRITAQPNDRVSAELLAAALFDCAAPVADTIAEMVLGSSGPWALRARAGVDPADRRRLRAADELDALGRLAHVSITELLESHGLSDAIPRHGTGNAPSRPPAFRALRDALVATPEWGRLVDRLVEFYAHEGTGPLATHQALRFTHGALVGIPHPDPITTDDLIGSDHTRAPLAAALRAFVAGGPANDALLYGPPGTGKSAAVRALAGDHTDAGLRLIQVDRADAASITALFALLEGTSPRCVVLLDDLVFDDGERTDRTLRAALDGDAAIRPENVVVWATSNRLKLMRETRSEREDDIESALGRGEKAALATRFGVRVAFTELTQDRFIEMAHGWVTRLGGSITDQLTPSAVRFARGGHGLTPRTARQFAVSWCAGTAPIAPLQSV